VKRSGVGRVDLWSEEEWSREGGSLESGIRSGVGRVFLWSEEEWSREGGSLE
jgi:hypothetical protein